MMDKTHTDNNHKECDKFPSLNKNQPSLSSLIIWNISKALEKNPDIDLMSAMRSAYERLEQDSCDVNAVMSQYPEDRHVACAVLAWQQLGHRDTDSLYEFIKSRRNKVLRDTSQSLPKRKNIDSDNSVNIFKRPKGFIDHKPSTDCKGLKSASIDTNPLIGPVLKLPVETKIIMRLENISPCAHHAPKASSKNQKNDVSNKVDAACCLDSACVARLRELETETADLRTRASKLARREAERMELLERAETAWRDLELGYQRRLSLAEEKEDDIAKQIKKLIEDRNAYKQACTTLAQQLSKRGEAVEGDRARLIEVENEVCDLACTRLRVSEETAQGDAAVADQQCKIVQLERDLQFKEEQARRKLLSIESVVDSSRGLTFEAERAMREELGAIKEHIAEISEQLLEEDAESSRISAELQELRQQKAEIFEDLEGCKQMCDQRMQGIVNELNKKRQILNELKEKAIDCQCKLPLDAAIEVKRTPSLAALCHCNPEEKILHSCSCTSVRSTLLSNLLADLFGGLQGELGDTGSLMPCQLLKCLEDKHNWDRASIVKTNLRNFFSQLLLGELDTAIATSVEKYHATWVGVSCADQAKVAPEPGEVENEGWQKSVLEKRAQTLASQLAEQLFQDKADELVQRAKDIVTSGPPPCHCVPHNKATAYPCLIKSPTIGSNGRRNDVTNPTYIKRTLQEVTLPRAQLENLKKETIKKEDLQMEEKMTKIVQQASGPNNVKILPNVTINENRTTHRSVNTEELKEINANKSANKTILTGGLSRKNNKKLTDINGQVFGSKFSGRSFKKIRKSYAVNLCLCEGKKSAVGELKNAINSNNFNSCKKNLSHELLPHISSVKYSKPIDKMYSKDGQNIKRKKTSKISCSNNCKCFHRIPSNTSIDKLLETLLKWNGDLVNCPLSTTMKLLALKCNRNSMKAIHQNSKFNNNKKSVDINEIQDDRSQNMFIMAGTETDHIPPITTSEYIGAINLDKSNEHVYNVIGKNEEELKHNGINNLLSKCLNTSACVCKKSIQTVFETNNLVKNPQSAQLLNKQLNLKPLTDIEKSKEENMIEIENLQRIDKCKSKASFKHKRNQISENNFVPNDKNCIVKFLGVTLTGTNDQKTSFSKKLTKKENFRNESLSINVNDQSDFSPKFIPSKKSNNLSNIKKQSSEIQYSGDNAEYQCQMNRDFVESSLDDNINEFKENNYECEKDLAKVLHDKKSCVCCNNDEAENLEVNTFYLLEKHLKYKLEQIKKSSCDTCVLPDEEEKIFLTIFDKVQQIISDCTNSVKCKCSVGNNNSISWNRVNSLLAEYLKIKIKQVQCSCIPNEDRLDSVLPSILQKVTNQIEKDLERLKSIYICKNDNMSELKKQLYETVDACNKEVTMNEDIQRTRSKELCLESVSVQGSGNLGNKDESCDALDIKDTKDMQISLSDLSLQLNSNEVIITRCYNLHDELTLQTYNPENTFVQSEIVKKSFQLEQINKNTALEIKKLNSHCSLTVPYVGYTLSCSCDCNLGSCVCSKSISLDHIKTIDKIWKMLEIKRLLLPPNVSYIMQSIPATVRPDDVINFVEVTEPSCVPLIPMTQSVKNMNASAKEEVVLKHSKDILNYNEINDHMTNTLDDIISVTTECLIDDDTLYWYDCSSTCNKKSEIMHKKLLYDSVYSPINKLRRCDKSDATGNINLTMCTSRSKDCDCVMVPVCHVKMLVENIENKLVNSQCTCDALHSHVCPIHSKVLHN